MVLLLPQTSKFLTQFLTKKITVLLQIKRIIQEENLVIWIYKTLYQIWFPLTLR